MTSILSLVFLLLLFELFYILYLPVYIFRLYAFVPPTIVAAPDFPMDLRLIDFLAQCHEAEQDAIDRWFTN